MCFDYRHRHWFLATINESALQYKQQENLSNTRSGLLRCCNQYNASPFKSSAICQHNAWIRMSQQTAITVRSLCCRADLQDLMHQRRLSACQPSGSPFHLTLLWAATEPTLPAIDYEHGTSCVRFVVFTAVTMMNAVFWDVTPCGSCMNPRFGGTWRLHHQGDKNRRTSYG
jgi:hypothetical protein